LIYRKYIIREFIFGIIFFIVFVPAYLYSVYTMKIGTEIIKEIIIICILTFVSCFLLMLYLYKKWYFNNINKIQEALAEIKDFQEENEIEE